MNYFSRKQRRLAMLASTILVSGLGAPALASSPHPNLDANGVDLTDGSYNLRLPVASIGSGQSRLDLIAYDGTTDNFSNIAAYFSSYSGTRFITISLGPSYDNFSSADGFAKSLRGTGATLTVNADNSLTYRTLDGTVIQFGNPAGAPGGLSNLCDVNNGDACTSLALATSSRDGMTVNYNWFIHENCSIPQLPDEPINCSYSWRLESVGNDAGYSINWAFANNGPFYNANPSPAWFRRTSAELRNANVSASSWPTVTYANPSTSVFTITTPGGKSWRIAGSGQNISGVRRPSASSDTTTISYGTNGVSSVTADGVTTGYNRTISGSTATMVVTDAQSNATTIVSDMTKYRPTSVTNALGQTTSMTYDSLGRPTEIASPEGNKVQYAYDSRGNVTARTLKAKAGSGLSDLVESAGYDTSCSNLVTCNRPNWTKDAKGNQTDYTYDATTGLILTATLPAASGGTNRPQTRYSYTTTNGVALLTGVSICQTGNASGCVGTADEVRVSASYNSNLLPTSVSQGAGDASLTATSAMTYDAIGNLLTVNGPLSGTADTTTFRYDADRAQVGAISPDPDGAGSRLRRAVKTTYNGDGQPVTTEIGTVNGTSDSDWAAFSTAEQTITGYDTNARPVTASLTSGGTAYAKTQYSYDSLGRLDCTATRMNPSAWGSLPSSACTLHTTGSYGPDRIVKNNYDALGRQSSVQTAYGTLDQATEVTSTFNSNGTLHTVKDGENNLTTYEYDGFDRLLKTRYPSATQGAGTSSSTDYEQLTYDANGNVTQRRLRDGQTIGFSYDNLNRVTVKDLSGSGIDQDVGYAYDLLGRLTLASDALSHNVGFTYDALGRRLTETSLYGGSKTFQYDLAGRRTRLTWPDGLYIAYDYDVTGNVAAIRENGATSGAGVLATYTYDSLARRTGVTRGNGTTSSYSYDAVSRLSSMGHDLSGSSYDLTIGSFAYNPAGQITSLNRSNDAYAWGGHYNEDRSATLNGLNQQSGISNATTSTSVSLTHDARGNISGVGGTSHAYSQQNLLYSIPGGYLYYDALMRLDYISASDINPNATLLDYDGDQLIQERLADNTIFRRYVPGPGTDEPIVWYEGSGTSDRRWLHTDERGSVIAVTDGSGAVLGINSYDPYGKPAAGNLGRFGYTGQAWLPELGMWYYKARIYNPANNVARFMQTDPIGYGSGMNIYAYVSGDPVNKSDPSGNSEFFASRPDYIDNAEESYATRGPSLIAGGHSFDGLGASGLVTFGLGRAGEQALHSLEIQIRRLEALSTSQYLYNGIRSGAFESAGNTSFDGQNIGVLGDAAEILSNALDSYQIGLEGERIARELLMERGVNVIGEQVRVMTSYGLRITDFLTINKLGKLEGFDAKMGYYARFTSLQLAKDREIAYRGGILVDRRRLSDNVFPGSHISYPTYTIHILYRYGY